MYILNIILKKNNETLRQPHVNQMIVLYPIVKRISLNYFKNLRENIPNNSKF